MSNYIYETVGRLTHKYGTADPFELLSALHVTVSETSAFKRLKGYCFLSNRFLYVGISSRLSEQEKRIVAAHELGHIVLHRKLLSVAPMQDTVLYRMADKTEYEANLFAADLLLSDAVVEAVAGEEPDYFSVCKVLNVSADLLGFKLFSMIKRGNRNFRLPAPIDSSFLKQSRSS